MNRPGGEAGRQGFAVRRPTRRSRRKLIIRLAVLVVLLGSLGWGGIWMTRSPYFAVKQVESGDYRFTDGQELERVFAGFLGQNIWQLSPAAVADSLERLPWIKDLKVHRRLPGSLAVDFREWRPLLLLEAERAGEGPLILVEEGRLLAFPEELTLPGLPVLVGAKKEVDPGSGLARLAPDQGDLVLDLVAAVEKTGLETACPIDFIVARAEGFGIVLQEGRGTLLVGREDFTSRLQRYMDARDHLEPGLQMDLRFADKITCRRM